MIHFTRENLIQELEKKLAQEHLDMSRLRKRDTTEVKLKSNGEKYLVSHMFFTKLN